MPYAFIDPAEILPATIPSFGPDPAVTIQYTRAGYEEVTEFNWGAQGGAKEQVKATITLLVGHVKAWDLTDKSGAATAVSEANLRALPQRIVERMATIVNGHSAEASTPRTPPPVV